MNQLDVEGMFWRPEEPDRRIAGHLRFNPTDGAVLSLIAPIPEFLGERADDVHGVRLVGYAGTHHLTLDQCYLTEGSAESGIVRSRYMVSTILTGAHFQKDEPLAFSSLSVQVSNLAQWVGRSGLRIDVGRGSGNEGVKDVGLTYTPLPPVVTDGDLGQIVLSFPWKRKLVPFGQSLLEHRCVLKYRFDEPQHLTKITHICSSLRDLVTICVHAPSAIIGTDLTHNDAGQSIQLYALSIGMGPGVAGDVIHRRKMSLTFDDIGGLDGIRSWLTMLDRYAVLIGLLVSHWYTPTLYQEQRYFNAIVAAETLIRIRKKKQSVKLDKELLEFAQEISGLFEPLVGDITTWAKQVVRIRDNYVVHPGLRGLSDGQQLYLFSESIYVFVVLMLLKECGVGDDSLKNTQNHAHFRWLARELGRHGCVLTV